MECKGKHLTHKLVACFSFYISYKLDIYIFLYDVDHTNKLARVSTKIASGNPVPSITWTKKSGVNISKSRLGEGPVLTLEKVDRQHAGVYQCLAENHVGDPVSIDMRLDVLCKFQYHFSVQVDNLFKLRILHLTIGDHTVSNKININFSLHFSFLNINFSNSSWKFSFAMIWNIDPPEILNEKSWVHSGKYK